VLLRSESLLLLLLLLQRRRSRDRARPHWIVSVQGLQKVGQEAPAGVVFAPDVVPGCDCGWARARWPPAASPPPPPLFLLVPRLLRRLADLPLLPPTPPPPGSRSRTGGEGATVTKESPDVREAVVEATDHVEDEGTVGDDLPKGAEVVGHPLQPATIVGDGEAALDEVVVSSWMARASRLPRKWDSMAARCPGRWRPRRR